MSFGELFGGVSSCLIGLDEVRERVDRALIHNENSQVESELLAVLRGLSELREDILAINRTAYLLDQGESEIDLRASMIMPRDCQ